MSEKTPYEAWYQRKPKVQFLRVFGCVAHVKVVTPHLKKLDDRSIPIVFIGYEPGTKAYRFYNPNTSKLVVSHDVVFEEDSEWDWVIGIRWQKRMGQAKSFRLIGSLISLEVLMYKLHILTKVHN